MDKCKKCGYEYIERPALVRNCPVCGSIRTLEVKDITVKK